MSRKSRKIKRRGKVLLGQLSSWIKKGKKMSDTASKAITTVTTYTQKCRHEATPVKVGAYTVWAASEQKITSDALKEIDFVVSLNGNFPGGSYLRPMSIMDCYMQDFSAPKQETWKLIVDYLAKQISEGSKILTFCTGGHGRTGTLVASLIAKLEPECEDPIAAVRERYCEKAVESLQQLKAIYEIAGKPLPEKYQSVASKWTCKGNGGYQGYGTSVWNPDTRTWDYNTGVKEHACKHRCTSCGKDWEHNTWKTECPYPESDRDLCTPCFSKPRPRNNKTQKCSHVCPAVLSDGKICGLAWEHQIDFDSKSCVFPEDGRDLCAACHQMKLDAANKEKKLTSGNASFAAQDENGNVICAHQCKCGKVWSHMRGAEEAECPFPVHNRDLCAKCFQAQGTPASGYPCNHTCQVCGQAWTHMLKQTQECTDSGTCNDTCEYLWVNKTTKGKKD